MEFFERAASVRVKSSCGKYLCAKDERLVSQESERNETGTIWSVEKVVTGSNNTVRIKSVNGMYLTALEVALFLGDKGNKVQQSYSPKADSAVEWEPIRVGKHQLNLKTKRGTYLRATGGMPPYKNSVTHSSTKKEAKLNSFLWEVEVVEYLKDELKGTLQSRALLNKMEHESIPAKIGAPDSLHQISTGQRRHRLSVEEVHEFVIRSAGSISSNDEIDYTDKTPHDSGCISLRPIPSDGTERATRICLEDEIQVKVRTPRSRDGRPGLISSEGTGKGTKISSYERGETVKTAGNKEHSSRPVSIVDGDERGTRISLDDETKDKVRNSHDRDGRPRPISSEGTEMATKISPFARGQTTRTLRNGEHRSRPVSFDGTEQLTRKSSDEREHTMNTPPGREPGSFDNAERGPRISLDDEREHKVRTPRHGDGRPGLISSEGTDHGTRTSSDERKGIVWNPRNRDSRFRPTSFDGDGRGTGISLDDKREDKVRTPHHSNGRSVPTPSEATKHGTRISSDERGYGMTTPHRDHTLSPVFSDEIDHRTRISSDESEHGLRTAARDRQVRLSSGEGRPLRDFSRVEGRESKIHSNDEEYTSASTSCDYEHRHGMHSDYKEHKFSRHERERNPPVAPSGHRWGPSSDHGAEQKRTSYERERNKVESAFRHRDSLDEEEEKSPKAPLTTRSRGRKIFFTVADAHGKYSTRREESFIFMGNNVNDLKQEIRIHTKMEEDIFVYIRNESDGKLFNLSLTLPPSRVSMHVVVARVNSEVGRKMQQWSQQTP